MKVTRAEWAAALGTCCDCGTECFGRICASCATTHEHLWAPTYAGWLCACGATDRPAEVVGEFEGAFRPLAALTASLNERA